MIRLWLSVSLCLGALLAPSWCAGADRTLPFPEESVGTLSIRPVSIGGFEWSLFNTAKYEGWTSLAPAAGEVVVPDGHFVQLELNLAGTSNLAWVDTLAIDAIDSLKAYGASIDDEVVHRLSRLTGLRSLELGGTQITSESALSLSKFTQLQYLGLSRTLMNDDAMSAIAKLPHLESVELYGTKITDTGLAFLSKSDSLKGVYVGGTKITDTGVAELCKLRDLRALNLIPGNSSQPSISDAVVDALCNRPSLEHLDLTGTGLTDAGLERLASGLPKLRKLVLDHTQVTAEGMQHLSGFTALEELRCYGLPFDDEIAQRLTALHKLRKIIGDIRISDLGVEALSQLPHLESLGLNGKRITDASMPALTRMFALKNLWLQSTRISDKGFSQLAGSKSLQHIQLTGNRITTRCVETLGTMPALRRVGLWDISPRVDGEPVWKGLEGLKSLESQLWLCGCPSLSAKDFRKLSKFSHLKRLRIEDEFQPDGGSPATNEDALALDQLNRLEFLELSSTVITDEGLRGLASLPALQGLSISCLATDAGLERIARSPALEYLTIASPAITDAAIERVRAESPRLKSIRRQPFRLSGTKVSQSTQDSFWREHSIDERKQLNELEGKTAPQLIATEWFNAPQESTLESFLGKVVLIEFWGTWCGPCIKQIPEIRRLHDQYADSGLVVIGIHSSKGSQEAADFVEFNQLTWPIALDDENNTKKAFVVKGWPSCYLIDRQGVLRMADIFDGDREAAIKALLSEER